MGSNKLISDDYYALLKLYGESFNESELKILRRKARYCKDRIERNIRIKALLKNYKIKHSETIDEEHEMVSKLQNTFCGKPVETLWDNNHYDDLVVIELDDD